MLYPIELLGQRAGQHINDARAICHARTLGITRAVVGCRRVGYSKRSEA